MAINLTNTSVDDIYLDIDNISTHVNRVKRVLSSTNESLRALKKSYTILLNDSRTKGNLKKEAEKIVTNIDVYIRKNDALSQQIEALLNSSTREYAQALSQFDDLGAMADTLGE